MIKINNDILIAMGFNKEVERIKNNCCPICNNKISVHPHAKFYRKVNPPNYSIEDLFRNTISYKEYTISGMCQNCQDKIFGVD